MTTQTPRPPKARTRRPLSAPNPPAPPPRPAIGLVLIVKNEAHVIQEALESVYPYLQSVCIVDTGSTDDTLKAIAVWGAFHPELPIWTTEQPWVDFGTNRTRALQFARETATPTPAYFWMFDADDALRGTLDLSTVGAADVYDLHFGDDLSWWRPALMRADRVWTYTGAIHEALEIPVGCSRARLHGAYYIDARHTGGRGRDATAIATKNYEDVQALQRAVDLDPRDCRTRFYLAQTYFGQQEWTLAKQIYAQRVAMTGGWGEETFYAAYRYAQCRDRLADPTKTIVQAYLDAYALRPTRIEPLVAAARRLRLDGQYALAYLYAHMATLAPMPDDALFVERGTYGWRRYDEAALAAHYTGRTAEALTFAEILDQARAAIPPSEWARLEQNRQHYLSARTGL